MKLVNSIRNKQNFHGFYLKSQTSHFSNVLVFETDSNKLTAFDLKYNLLYFAMIVSVA